MIKCICRESLSFLKKDSIYYVDIALSKTNYTDELFTDYLEVFDSEEKYLGGFWIDKDRYFIDISEFRDERINQILEDD